MAPTLTAVLQKKAVGKDGSGGYQKRYFCLCTSSIMYYERAPADGAFDHHPKGVFYLADCSVSATGALELAITAKDSGRSLNVKCDSPQQHAQWLAALQAASQMSAAAFQQLQADKQAAAQQAARDKEEIEKLRAELSSVKSVLSEHDIAAQARLEAEKAEIDKAEKVLQSMGM